MIFFNIQIYMESNLTTYFLYTTHLHIHVYALSNNALAQISTIRTNMKAGKLLTKKFKLLNFS